MSVILVKIPFIYQLIVAFNKIFQIVLSMSKMLMNVQCVKIITTLQLKEHASNNLLKDV